jgi:WD40 repeat protein
MKYVVNQSVLGLMLLILLSFAGIAEAQLTVPSDISSMRFNSSGDRIAITSSDGIRIYDAEFNLIQTLLNQNDTSYRLSAWSLDGTHLMINGSQIYNSTTLQPVKTITAAFGFGGWSMDGSLFWTLASDVCGIAIVDPLQDEIIQSIPTGELCIESALWSPDNSRFLTLDRGAITLIGIRGGNTITDYQIDGFPRVAIWSPDSAQVAVAITTEVPLGTLGSHPTTSSGVIYSLRIIDANTGETIQHFDLLEANTRRLFWDVYTNQLTAIMDTNAMVTWDLDTNQRVDSYVFARGMSEVAQSPYGGRVLVEFDETIPLTVTSEVLVPMSNELSVASYLNGLVQVIVPAPSLERLQTIQAACVSATVEAQLGQPTTVDVLPQYIAQVEALNEAEISAGCAADLVAVAQAVLLENSSLTPTPPSRRPLPGRRSSVLPTTTWG